MTGDQHRMVMVPRTKLPKSNPKATSRRGHITRNRILLTAEKLFALEGYDGASIRDITSASRVDVGIVNYHFGSKENLFREVLLMRASEINRQRHENLKGVAIVEGSENSLRQILDAFLTPITGTTQSGSRKLAHYRRLIAIVVNSRIWQKSVFEAHYDSITQELVEAVRLVLPWLTLTRVYWQISFFLGAMAKAVAQLGEIDALSSGACSSANLIEIRAEIVDFTVGALLFSAARSERSEARPV